MSLLSIFAVRFLTSTEPITEDIFNEIREDLEIGCKVASCEPGYQFACGYACALLLLQQNKFDEAYAYFYSCSRLLEV